METFSSSQSKQSLLDLWTLITAGKGFVDIWSLLSLFSTNILSPAIFDIPSIKHNSEYKSGLLSQSILSWEAP